MGAMAGLRPKTPEVRRPPATPMISREIRERGGLYAGAAGGGKSHPMRVAAIMWCCTIHDLQASRDGLHGKLWGVAREIMGGILKFLRLSALNLFSTDDRIPGGGHE